MAVLVVADNDNAHLRDATHKTVTAAQKISGDIDILVLGKGAKGVADQAAKIAGVRKVLLAESDALGHGIAEAQADAVLALAGNYDAILVPATSAFCQASSCSLRPYLLPLAMARASRLLRVLRPSWYSAAWRKPRLLASL